MNRVWAGELLRFLIGGMLNVVVGYGSYLLLLQLLPYEISYAIAYVIGIAVSYVFSAVYVFRQPMNWRSAMRFPVVYILQFVVSFVLLKVLVEKLLLPQRFAPLVISVVMIPMTFLASRAIIRTN